MIDLTKIDHILLQKQLEKSLDDKREIGLTKFLKYVKETYEMIDQERYLFDRAINMMSDELTAANKDLVKQAEELRKGEERYELAAKGANDGLWDWDIETGKCFYSMRWREIVGFHEHDKLETIDDWLKRIHSSHQQNVKTILRKHLDGLTERFEAEYQIKTSDGKFIWVVTRGLAARNKKGEAIRIAGSQTDISQRKKYEDQLYKAAFHDKLTGVPNRALFMDRLKQSLKGFKRKNHNKKAALLFLDLDRFKIINDSLGHEAGDQILVSVTRRLELTLRPTDTLCRLGGDEFTILLESIESEEQASQIGARIIDELSKPFFIYSQQVFISASIGIVVIDHYEEPENLMRNADLAMYQAKNNGKSRAELFDKNQCDLIYSTLQLETDMRNGIESKEFIPFFQPIVDITTGDVVSLEALMRWNHPQKSILQPGNFIDIAEETGMIKRASEVLFHKICNQLQMWDRAFGQNWSPEVAINLSAKQIFDPTHLKVLFDIIEKSKIDPKKFVFELTETTLMDNSAYVGACLKDMKDRGFSLAIDDFGTGYSSLSYLAYYPFDKLKIDRSFVTNISEDIKKEKLIRGIILLAKDLGMKTIAEGVETQEELKKLKELKCEYVQGFYFSKPMSANDTLNFLTSDDSDKKTEVVRKLKSTITVPHYSFDL